MHTTNYNHFYSKKTLIPSNNQPAINATPPKGVNIPTPFNWKRLIKYREPQKKKIPKRNKIPLQNRVLLELNLVITARTISTKE